MYFRTTRGWVNMTKRALQPRAITSGRTRVPRARTAMVARAV